MPQEGPEHGHVSAIAVMEASPTPTRKAEGATKSLKPPQAGWFRRWKALVVAGVMLLLLGLLTLWAAGALRVKTSKGDILVIWVNETNPDILVEGEKVTVKWGEGGTQAEISAPDPDKVQVKKAGYGHRERSQVRGWETNTPSHIGARLG